MANRMARDLRRNSTNTERRLWAILRDRRLEGYKFRRQRPIGPYIVDFACIEHRLVIEADGGQHADSTTDEARNGWLQSHGWRLVRFWNNDILANTEGVLDTLLRILREPIPSPTQPAGLGPPSPAERERV